MKNLVTFLVIAIVIIAVVAIIKRPGDDMNNGAAGTMPEGSDMTDNGMVGGDAAVEVELGGQGDTTAQ